MSGSAVNGSRIWGLHGQPGYARQADSFMDTLKTSYQKETGIDPSITLCQAEDGAGTSVL